MVDSASKKKMYYGCTMLNPDFSNKYFAIEFQNPEEGVQMRTYLSELGLIVQHPTRPSVLRVAQINFEDYEFKDNDKCLIDAIFTKT